MSFDPESSPGQAQQLAELLASGHYVELVLSCPDCRGGLTAVVKRTVLTSLTAACPFCASPQVSALTLDPMDQPQLAA